MWDCIAYSFPCKNWWLSQKVNCKFGSFGVKMPKFHLEIEPKTPPKPMAMNDNGNAYWLKLYKVESLGTHQNKHDLFNY